MKRNNNSAITTTVDGRNDIHDNIANSTITQ